MTQAYGAWPSPLSADLLATGGVGLSEPTFDGDAICWLELRPTEGGRVVLVRDGADVVPADLNVRTRVHEYGGGAYTMRDGVAYCASFADQRWYRVTAGAEPEAITPAPAVPAGDRFADPDLSPDGGWLHVVRERHHADGTEATNELVAVPLAGGVDGPDRAAGDSAADPLVFASGHDFYAGPRMNPDATRLAWLAWDHPNLPWDGTELCVADLLPDGSVGEPATVAGGPAESIFQPEWSPDGVLHFVSDRDGWWNLYRYDDGAITQLTKVEAELGVPAWVFAQSTYGVLDDGRIACLINGDGRVRLGLLDRDGTLDLELVDLPYTRLSYLRSDGRRLLLVAAGPADEPAIIVIDDVDDPKPRTVKRASERAVDAAIVAEPLPISFPTAGGQTAHAIYYPPRNDAASPPTDEQPPLLVFTHGGPTAQVHGVLALGILYWTSRGFAVVDVNYGGSTGYGRAYRERLNGRWGVVDVEDCVAAARHLAEQGLVDPARTAIRGGSAGGWTTLCALAFTDAFAAGANHFGVADLETFVHETHKFESRYLDNLVGPWPEAAETYKARSPVHHPEGFNRPCIVFQGLEDEIVPPSQSEQIVAGLRANGVPHAYLEFAGEQHGFRKAESIKRTAEAELSFYGQVFGFTPAGDIAPVELRTT